MTIEENEQFLQQLTRIASALEKQNVLYEAWTQQIREHETSDIGPEVVAMHRENAQREETWIAEKREKLEAHYARQEELARIAHEELKNVRAREFTTYLHATQEVLDALCERVDIKKPDWKRLGERNG